MNKEECMLALEQIILELPQYRKITNELCNRYIPIYVKETYEEEQIYLEGNCGSSRDYCWDVYDTVPIEIVESILDYFKEQDDIKEENTNLKQALNDIYKYIKEKTREDMPNKKCLEENKIAYGTIKYIIDKVLGDEK